MKATIQFTLDISETTNLYDLAEDIASASEAIMDHHGASFDTHEVDVIGESAEGAS